MFIPDLADPARLSWILDPWSKRLRITDPDPHQIFFFLFPAKTISKLSEKGSGMFIPDPRSGFFLHPGSRTQIQGQIGA
jgi:hypothetical protein